MTQIEQKKNQDDVLLTLLEQFVLSPEELEELKQKINQFTTSKLTSTELKEYLLHSRITLLNNLKEFFPFYAIKFNSDRKYKMYETGENGQNDGEIIRLKQELHERETLLQTLIPRIHILEEKLGLTPERVSNSSEDDKKADCTKEIKRALDAINISLWLSAFPTDEGKKIIRNDYQFYQRFFTALAKYHDDRFNVPEGEKATNLERIAHLVKAGSLKEALVKMLAVRTSLSHSFYVLSNEDIEQSYTTYFQFICYMLNQELDQNLLKAHTLNIRSSLNDFIKQTLNNHPFIASIGCKVISDTF